MMAIHLMMHMDCSGRLKLAHAQMLYTTMYTDMKNDNLDTEQQQKESKKKGTSQDKNSDNHDGVKRVARQQR